jgi:hypothetical protein
LYIGLSLFLPFPCFLPFFLPSFLFFLPSFLFFLPSFLPSVLPSFLVFLLSPFLHSYLPPSAFTMVYIVFFLHSFFPLFVPSFPLAFVTFPPSFLSASLSSFFSFGLPPFL